MSAETAALTMDDVVRFEEIWRFDKAARRIRCRFNEYWFWRCVLEGLLYGPESADGLMHADALARKLMTPASRAVPRAEPPGPRRGAPQRGEP